MTDETELHETGALPKEFYYAMTDETELHDLERRLGEPRAKHLIECYTLACAEGWYDTTDCSRGKEWALKDAIRYLELRGLLERKPDAPHLVRVKETNDGDD